MVEVVFLVVDLVLDFLLTDVRADVFTVTNDVRVAVIRLMIVDLMQHPLYFVRSEAANLRKTGTSLLGQMTQRWLASMSAVTLSCLGTFLSVVVVLGAT